MSQSLDNKTIAKKNVSKKQDLKGILKHIVTLESKVDLMLDSFEKVSKIQSIGQVQERTNKNSVESQPNVLGLTTSPIPIMSPYMHKDILDMNRATPSPIQNPQIRSVSPHPRTDTPLNLLADVITNQYQQRLISGRIHEDNAKGAFKNESWTHSPITNNSKTESVSSINSTHTAMSTYSEADFLIKHNWTTLRGKVPANVHAMFDSINLNDMYVDFDREKKIYALLERIQVPKIPTLKIMTQITNIFLSMKNLYVILPIETYDLQGIINKWKVDGFKSLNKSHLLLLNTVGSFVCKEIKTTLFTDDDDVDYKNKMKEEVTGFESSLGNKTWLDEWEYFFLVNSFLHFQSISMFPDGLSSVQGVLLLGIYVKTTGLSLSASLMQTTAIRICQDLGLHSEMFLNGINKNKKHLRDKKKKIWWFCCFTDELLSMIYSKPRMIIHYTSSIKFLHDGKTKIIEVLENELRREVLLKEAHDKAHKFQDNLDNSDIIDNLKVQIQNTIISIYKEEGIHVILKYYFFKIVNIIQNNEGKLEQKVDSSVYEQLLDDFIDFSNNLPDIVKDPEGCDVWGDDCFFLYLIHLVVYFVQDHAYQHLYDTNDSEMYVDFMKTNIELITKIQQCKTSYNAMFGCFNEILFSRVLKIVEYHANRANFARKEAVNDFEMMKLHIRLNLRMTKEKFDFAVRILDVDFMQQFMNMDENSIQSIDPWLRKKQIIFIKLMVIFGNIIESRGN